MVNEYFVQCGNWCLRLNIDPHSFEHINDCYVELATRALEIIFGDKEFFHPDDDYYAILNENGVNIFEHDDEDIPEPTFTTKIHILSSNNNEPNKLLTILRTSDIFANAAQNENYELALKAEKLESK